VHGKLHAAAAPSPPHARGKRAVVVPDSPAVVEARQYDRFPVGARAPPDPTGIHHKRTSNKSLGPAK